MRQANGWLFQEINGEAHLIPYGQNIADQKRGVYLNSTGAYLWNMLNDNKSLTKEEMYERLREICGFTAEEEKQTRQDVMAFLQSLIHLGIFIEDEGMNEPYYKTLEIGGLTIKLYGLKVMFPSEFLPFEKKQLDGKQKVFEIYVHNQLPRSKKNGTVVLRNKELVLMEDKRMKRYIFLFPSMKHILEACLEQTRQRADFYVVGQVSDEMRDELFHAIRFIYLYWAQIDGIFAIHSASLLYRQKVWVFSASSGTGKTTHTSLWNAQFDTPLINGDLNLITLRDGKPMVLGLPWCGTSGIFDTREYPLGGIILLERASKDWVEILSKENQARFVMQRLISPMWTANQARQCLAFSQSLTKTCYTVKLHCTKEPSAADTMRQAIDEYVGCEKSSTSINDEK